MAKQTAERLWSGLDRQVDRCLDLGDIPGKMNWKITLVIIHGGDGLQFFSEDGVAVFVYAHDLACDSGVSHQELLRELNTLELNRWGLCYSKSTGNARL